MKRTAKRNTMLRLGLLSLGLLLFAESTFAQNRVRARDLEGTTWKMVFDLDNEKTRAEADGAFGRIILSAVDGLLDEVNIYFTFEHRGRLFISVDAFGEDDDEERSDWEISADGSLMLGHSGSYGDEDTIWRRKGDLLIPYERNRKGKLERSDAIYLKRID